MKNTNIRLDLSGSGLGSVLGECINVPMGSIKEAFIDQVNNYKLLKKNPLPQSWYKLWNFIIWFSEVMWVPTDIDGTELYSNAVADKERASCCHFRYT